MSSSGRFSMLLVCALVVACGGEPSEPGQNGEAGAGSEVGSLNPNTRGDSPTLRQLRGDLAGTDAAVRIVRARLVDVLEAAPPIPSLGGAAILVGYSSAGAVNTAMPFSLPRVVRIEPSKDGLEPGGELPIDEGSLSLFLDARDDLTRIEVLGDSGAVLATLADTEFEAPELLAKQSSFEPLSPLQELRRGYPHIDFLGPAESVGLKSPKGLIETVEIGVKEARDIRDALNRMSDATFGAIRTLAVARFEADTGSEGSTYGSTVLVNWTGADLGAETSKVWVHEATHAYEFLINGGGLLAVLNKVDWPEDVRAAARDTIQDFSLQAGLGAVWDDLHQDAVDAGLGGPYLGSGWKGLGTAEDADIAAAPLGFVSAYGAADASEDLAEYVGRLVIGEYGASRPACDLIKSAGDPFPVERALPYIKAKFLEGLGLVSSSQAQSCTGTPSIEGPPGIHVGGVGFTQGIRGGFIDIDGGHFLGVLASAPPYQMLIRVLAPEQQPRGIYRLDNIGYSGIDAPINGVLLGHDTEPLRARTSARGLVLVSEYSPQRIAGAVFFLMLRNAPGAITDSIPLGTFRVDNP